MNCKPGDWAMYVGRHKKHQGKVTRVRERIELTEKMKAQGAVEGVWWITSPPICGCGFAADRALKPIRDPGEDAKDESLSWLSAPTKEVA